MGTTIIAEIGMTHDGSFGQAQCMIKAAAECGVNAVKFQTHLAEAETLPWAPTPPYFKNESRWSYFKRTAFTLDQHKELKKVSEEHGVEFISSPFSIEAIELLENVGVSTYKVASGEVTNIPFLEVLGKTQKKVLLSSGMSTWKELEQAIETLEKNGCSQLVLMQCTSEYPCPPESAGLNIMQEMQKRFAKPVGFSDHTIGIGVPLAAVCLGAKVIEKHFTLSRLMYGPDAKNSIEPHELKQLVTEIRAAEVALNSNLDKDLKAKSLSHMKVTFEKSVVLTTALSKGTIISKEHLSFKKPGDGIPARDYQSLLGKVLRNDLPKDHQLKLEDLV